MPATDYSWKEDRSLSVENSKQWPRILSRMWKQVFGKTKVKGHIQAVSVGENQSTWIVKTISGEWK